MKNGNAMGNKRSSGIKKPSQVCVHSESHRTEITRNCIREFQCNNCAFDQWLDAVDEIQRLNKINHKEADRLMAA